MTAPIDFVLLDAHLLFRGPTNTPVPLDLATDGATELAPTSRVVELMAALEESVNAAKKARQP